MAGIFIFVLEFFILKSTWRITSNWTVGRDKPHHICKDQIVSTEDSGVASDLPSGCV
jgi:hypothetical protein